MPQQQGSLISNTSFLTTPPNDKQKAVAGAAALGIAGTLAVGNALQNRSEGRYRIDSEVADEWIRKNMPQTEFEGTGRRGSSPDQSTIDLIRSFFSKNKKDRVDAFNFAKSSHEQWMLDKNGLSPAMYKLAQKAFIDGGRYADPSLHDLPESNLLNQSAAERALVKAATEKQLRLDFKGQDIENDKAFDKWLKSQTKGAVTPRPADSTYTFNQSVKPIEVVGNTTAKRESQVGRFRERPTLEAGAVRANMADTALTNSRFGKVFDFVKNAPERLAIPALKPFFATKVGNAVGHVGNMAALTGGSMIANAGVRALASNQAKGVKASDAKALEAATLAPEAGIAKSANDAVMAANLSKALKSYQYNVDNGIRPSNSLINTLESKYGLKAGELSSFLTKQGKYKN
jgi:hypothetical protein